VYYLNIIKEIFFFSPEYKINPLFKNLNLKGNIFNRNNNKIKNVVFNYRNITISSPMAVTISIITLNKEWLSMGAILVQILFNY